MFRLFVFIILAVFTLSSCDFDDDDDNSLSNFWVDFGLTDNVDESANSYTIKLDDGPVLYPVTTLVPDFGIKADQRLLVNFTILGDKKITNTDEEYYVRINSLKEILYKDIFEITEETEDSIGNDPVHVKKAWLTDNMLTFEMTYYGNSQIHYINLVKQPGELAATDEPVQLELRHNNRNDEPYLQLTAFVTFKLDNIKIAGQDSVKFKVTGVDFNNTKYEDTGVFYYHNN